MDIVDTLCCNCNVRKMVNDFRVDVVEKLLAPSGLVCSGVAPDCSESMRVVKRTLLVSDIRASLSATV